MKDHPKHLAKHHGIFRRKLSLFEGTALILSGTIGAGIVGIPYAIAQVGLGIGLIYILAIGVLMTGLNVLIGELAIKIGKPLQLVGFAERYLGKPGKFVMTVLLYALLFGVLVVYIIGEGETLSALFGGSPFMWSLIFYALGSLVVVIGLRTAKTVELLLTLFILAVVLALAAVSAPHISIPNITTYSFANLLLPYGVLLFAYHGTTSLPEAHALLHGKDGAFRKSILLAGLISTLVYMLFATMVVGVTGTQTTEIATIGLGRAVGPIVFILANVFSILAMGSSFVMAGLALRDSLRWDFKMSYTKSTVLTLGVPAVLFLFGLRGFIAMIGLVGGVLMSIELVLLTIMYWLAKQRRDWRGGPFHLHHVMILLTILLIAFTVGGVYSVASLF